jgi:hypothetical protein
MCATCHADLMRLDLITRVKLSTDHKAPHYAVSPLPCYLVLLKHRILIRTLNVMLFILTKGRATKVYGRLEVKPHAFLTSTPDANGRLHISAAGPREVAGIRWMNPQSVWVFQSRQ